MRSKIITRALYILTTIFIMSACAPIYVPTTVNTPMFKQKGEVQAAVYGGTSGFNPQFAYSFTNHFGVMANGSFQNQEADSTGDFQRHRFAEIGIGYYLKLNEFGRFEVFGGYGFGDLQAKYDYTLFRDYSDMRFGRVFIQPAIGFSNKIVDLSFASRFVIIMVQQNSLSFNRTFFEPCFTAKTGYKYVKFVVQIGYSMPFNSNNIIEYQPFMFSVGLHFTINKKYD